jgi:hypothetical protein
VSLHPTKHRKAMLRAVDEPGRIYGEAGEIWDKQEGCKITSRIEEATHAGWVHAVPRAGYRDEWSPQRTYFELTDAGREAKDWKAS